MKYPKNMDKPCIPLCNALNSIPGIRTFESCCGHGQEEFQLWFCLHDKRKARYLTVIGRVFDRRYGGLNGWSCKLDNTDTPKNTPTFFIGSGNIKGIKAYSDSRRIAKNIHDHLKHKAFRKLFLN